MFSQTWRKYLPVIILLMKRSGKGEQVLSMNHTDFERAAGGKKIKFTFSDLSPIMDVSTIGQNIRPLPMI